jgi:hypothetical protein
VAGAQRRHTQHSRSRYPGARALIAAPAALRCRSQIFVDAGATLTASRRHACAYYAATPAPPPADDVAENATEQEQVLNAYRGCSVSASLYNPARVPPSAGCRLPPPLRLNTFTSPSDMPLFHARSPRRTQHGDIDLMAFIAWRCRQAFSPLSVTPPAAASSPGDAVAFDKPP